MHQLVAYHRPSSMADAIELLGVPNRVIVAGGSTIRHDVSGEPVELVDLQALGLDDITVDAGPGSREVITIGAMNTLQSLVDSDVVPELIRRAAKAELPSTLRSVATLGGTIGATEADSVLLAALLVHDSTVHLADDRSLPLADVLTTGLSQGDIIVAVSADTSGATALARTGRTPADTPIVAAVGRASADGVRLALTGIARTPELVDPGRLHDLDPPGDFRGSSAYRRHLADVLSARVLEALS